FQFTDHLLPRFHFASSFLSYLSRQHLVLHSFPTRRSSDLNFYRHCYLRSRIRNGACRKWRACFGLRPSTRQDWGIRGNGGWTERDRKSTRLNSSHGSISYAVFCLKKKSTT